MMRIGLVCPYDLREPGGVQSQVLGLARALTRAGDDVSTIGPGLPGGVAGVDLGATVSIPANRSVAPVSLDPRVRSRLKEAALDVDLLHVHEPLMPAASVLALRVGRPVVATFHAAPGTIGAGFYRLVGSRLGQVLGPHVKKVTAVSRAASNPLPDDLDVAIVPNGVDLSSFDLETERVPGRVVFLGRDERRKGLDVLLHAWDLVTPARPGAELVVMGAHRPVEGITWMGPVGDETKAATLCSSSVYVAPNLGSESFGIILIEGMAAGVAVLASDLEAFRDVGGDAVRYFKTGDPNDLAAKLIELLADETERTRLAQAGRDRVRRFDWGRVSAEYRSLYEEALSSST